MTTPRRLILGLPAAFLLSTLGCGSGPFVNESDAPPFARITLLFES